jgi:hypothetical protein
MARFLAVLINILIALAELVLHALVRVTKWWGQRMQHHWRAGQKGLAAAWLVGGLCAVCTAGTLVLPSSPSQTRPPRDVAAVPGAHPSPTERLQRAALADRATRTPRNSPEPAATSTDEPKQEPTREPTREATDVTQPSATSAPPPATASLVPPTATIPPTATPEPPTVLIQVETLNARTGPSDQYDVLTQVPNGTELPALAFSSDRAWVQVMVGGNTPAWVRTEFVQLNRTDALGTAEGPELVASPTSPPTATRPPAPTSPPAPPPSTGGGYNGPYDPYGPDVDCGHFSTHAQAQAFYRAAGGPASDPYDLDRDRDGIACETLP